MKKLFFVFLGAAPILSLSFLLISASPSIPTLKLKPIKTFGGIDVPEEAILNSPSDIVISEEGEIIVSDSRENKIFLFDYEGKVIRKIGRQGNGPGELNRPRFIWIEDGTIKVFEAGNNRIQYFSKNGEHLRMIPCKFNVGTGMLTFGFKDDVFFVTTGFRTEELISHYQISGQKLDSIGKIEGKPFEFYDMLKIQQALIKKELPDVCRNDLFLLVIPGSRVYAVFQALPFIKIYSIRGELEKTVSLDLPEFEKIKDRCSQFNVELRKKGMPAFQTLNFWRDGVLMANGDLILLISDPEKMTLFRFDKDGKLLARYQGVDDDISLIAAHESYLWAYGRETQIFYQFKIE